MPSLSYTPRRNTLNLLTPRLRLERYLMISCNFDRFLPCFSVKSPECLEMFSAILSTYKTIVEKTTLPSDDDDDDDPRKLPLGVVQVNIVPALQKLSADFKKASSTQELTATQLIGQLEAAYGRTFVLHLPTSTSSTVSTSEASSTSHTSSGLSLLTPSPSMDEVKSRVGKIFQKPAQSFWKK